MNAKKKYTHAAFEKFFTLFIWQEILAASDIIPFHNNEIDGAIPWLVRWPVSAVYSLACLRYTYVSGFTIILPFSKTHLFFRNLSLS